VLLAALVVKDEAMELREMRAFVAVVEEGGLSAAARRLHLSQPALSQTINTLERELGVRLLVRTSTGAQPTEAGMTLLAEARAVLARYDQALSAVSRHGTAEASVLRIGIPLELPTDLLAQPLSEVATAYPATRVGARHLSTSEQFAALRAGELDIGLVREHPAGQDLDAMLVTEERLGVLLAAEQAERLAGLDWVGFDRSESPAWYDEITAILRSHGIDLGAPAPAGQELIADVKLAAVIADKAFAFAPPDWPQPIPAAVTWSPLAGHPLIRRTWAVWPASSRRRDVGLLVSALGRLWPP
jgi:DNA-binding transcriptional LysR family regulator